MAGKNDFKVLQVTDTHLFAKTKEMFGIDCNKNFLSVIDEIKQNEKGFDFILATGDIAQDESIEAYQFFRDSLNSFKVPVYWISGNHDDPIKMQEAFSQSPYFFQQKKLTKHNWDFIFIDSKISGKDTGLVTDNELKKLEVQLSQSQKDEKFVAIIMHHHPMPVFTPLVDDYILENGEAFLAVTEKYQNVKLVICGHVHGDYSLSANGFILETAPATCLQWEKGVKNLTVDSKIGYKIYQFTNIGYFAKGVLWDSQ